MSLSVLAAPFHERQRDSLDALVASYDYDRHRATDPVSFVHRYDGPHDREVVGLIAASLAFGNVRAIRASVSRVLDRLGEHPATTIDEARPQQLERLLDGFVHRVWRGEHLATLLSRAGALRRGRGTLGHAFVEHHRGAPDLRTALAEFADELRGPSPSVGLAHMVPDPRKGSACKRLLLYLRWMCRPADGVDLGLWDVPPSALIIPVDTHVLRIGQNLGLTQRHDASWRTAEEITRALARYDPHDPVKYDFAICHLGVSRSCPSRRDDEKCGTCELKQSCLQWHPPTVRSGTKRVGARTRPPSRRH